MLNRPRPGRFTRRPLASMATVSRPVKPAGLHPGAQSLSHMPLWPIQWSRPPIDSPASKAGTSVSPTHSGRTAGVISGIQRTKGTFKT